MSASPNPRDGDLTELLVRARGGDASASESFWRQVYGELRALAERELGKERAGHTLAATALVHEAYLRLLGPDPLPFENRAHFFGAAARAMRRILVDHARRRARPKHGGGAAALPLTGLTLADHGPGLDLLALDEALERLQAIDARKVQVVELRFFAGLTEAEIAEILGVSTGTVAGDWKVARLWLHRELSPGERDGP